MPHIDNIIIKKATIDELEALHVLSYATFFESFAQGSTLESIRKYLDQHMTASAIAAQFHDKDSEFYILKVDDKLIGYFKLNFKKSPDSPDLSDSIELQRLYVLSKYQNHGYGKMLLDKALDLANQSDSANIWLGVWQKNLKAISFYKNHGFEPFGEHLFFVGESEEVDILMKKAL